MDAIIIVGLVLLGWLMGGLINYLADVLPTSRKITFVACPGCGASHTITTYLLLRHCPKCGARRAIRAWIVQVLAIGVTIAQWHQPSPRLGFIVGTILMTYFGVVAVIDIEHHLILHPTSIFGAILGASIGLWLHGLVSTLLGGAAGLGIMFLLYLLGWLMVKGIHKLTGRVIEEDALGFGDIILSGIMGLLLGWPGIALGLVYTIFIAGAGSLLVILGQLVRRRYQAFTAVAFGPYLLIAACLLLYMPK